MNSNVEQIKEALKTRMCNTILEDEVIQSIRNQVSFMGFVEGDRMLLELLLDDYERISEELTVQINYLDEIGEFDPVMQISNRNSILRVIEREWEGSKRYHTHTSLIIFSVDALDEDHVADEDAANRLYVEMAKLIDISTRMTDTFGRLGDNKFAVVVPTTNNIQATWLSNKLKETIADYEFRNGVKITCAFGVADCSDSMNAEEWLEIAGAAHQKAVEAGGNTVVDYESIVKEPNLNQQTILGGRR